MKLDRLKKGKFYPDEMHNHKFNRHGVCLLEWNGCELNFKEAKKWIAKNIPWTKSTNIRFSLNIYYGIYASSLERKQDLIVEIYYNPISSIKYKIKPNSCFTIDKKKQTISVRNSIWPYVKKKPRRKMVFSFRELKNDIDRFIRTIRWNRNERKSLKNKGGIT